MNRIPWTKPEQWGLKWFDTQRLPEPFEELYRNEFDWLWLKSDSIYGIYYEQCFLDWGAGPLVRNPQISWHPASRSYYNYDGMECSIEESDGIKYGKILSHDRTYVQVEVDSYTIQAPVEQVLIKIIYVGSGGWRGNQWSTHFYWFDRYGLAISDIYCAKRSYENNCELYEEQNYDLPTFITGHGDFLADPSGKLFKQQFGFARRFFRIGCKHSNLIHSSANMFEHTTVCKDCGWSETTDSSG